MRDTETSAGGWSLARRTTLGIAMMGTVGALAGFACARLLWM